MGQSQKPWGKWRVSHSFGPSLKLTGLGGHRLLTLSILEGPLKSLPCEGHETYKSFTSSPGLTVTYKGERAPRSKVALLPSFAPRAPPT